MKLNLECLHKQRPHTSRKLIPQPGSFARESFVLYFESRKFLIITAYCFDTVDHRILLGKLYFNGFRGVLHNWFLSYLTGRKQTTEVGSHISSS